MGLGGGVAAEAAVVELSRAATVKTVTAKGERMGYLSVDDGFGAVEWFMRGIALHIELVVHPGDYRNGAQIVRVVTPAKSAAKAL